MGNIQFRSEFIVVGFFSGTTRSYIEILVQNLFVHVCFIYFS